MGDPSFAHQFVKHMYQTLFPYINARRTELDPILLNNCFENGAFVFKDKNCELFNYLAATGRQPADPIGTLYAKTHLIPRQLFKKQKRRRRQIRGHYGTINFIFHQPGGEEVEVDMKHTWYGSHFSSPRIVQFERMITPKIAYLCNPECETATRRVAVGTDEEHGPVLPLTYCKDVGKKPKGVMKFYCYSLEYVANGTFNNPTNPEVRNIFRDGPFTYIKLESGPKSLQLLRLLRPTSAAASVKRHGMRNVEKWRTRRADETKVRSEFNNAKCWRQDEHPRYCYRAEDYGWRAPMIKNTEEQGKLNAWDRHFNQFEGLVLTEDARDEIKNYSSGKGRPRDARGSSLDKFKLRAGLELYVPQQLTDAVLEGVHRRDEGGGGDNTGGGEGGGSEEAGGTPSAAAPNVSSLIGGWRGDTHRGKRQKGGGLITPPEGRWKEEDFTPYIGKVVILHLHFEPLGPRNGPGRIQVPRENDPPLKGYTGTLLRVSQILTLYEGVELGLGEKDPNDKNKWEHGTKWFNFGNIKSFSSSFVPVRGAMPGGGKRKRKNRHPRRRRRTRKQRKRRKRKTRRRRRKRKKTKRRKRRTRRR